MSDKLYLFPDILKIKILPFILPVNLALSPRDLNTLLCIPVKLYTDSVRVFRPYLPAFITAQLLFCNVNHIRGQYGGHLIDRFCFYTEVFNLRFPFPLTSVLKYFYKITFAEFNIIADYFPLFHKLKFLLQSEHLTVKPFGFLKVGSVEANISKFLNHINTPGRFLR